MKRFLIWIVACLSLASPLFAQQQINLRDADIRAFIQDAARATGKTFIIDQRVQGKVSIVTDRPLSRSEYFEVFLSTLRANGYVAIPTVGGGYRIQPVDTAAAQPTRVGASGAARNAFVTEVFRLRSIDAASAVDTLRPLVSREGSVTSNRSGNSLVVADYADNVRRIRALLQRIDVETAATEMIVLRNASAKEVAASLQILASGGQAGGQGGRNAVAIVAVESSNSIAFRGDRPLVDRFARMARDFDRRAESGAEMKVYWLRNADAEQLLPVLQQLAGQQVSASAATASAPSAQGSGAGRSGGTQAAPVAASTPTGEASGPVGRNKIVIARFEGSNAIIISAPPETQRSLGDVIRQLDVRRPQILVEAIIVEISDNAARKLGVQFLLGGNPGSNIPFAATNYSNAAPNILTVAGAIGARQLNTTTTTVNGTTTVTTANTGVSDQLAQAAIGSILSASGGFGGFATNIGNNGVFGAIINAVREDNQSNILSTPSITTIDNRLAHFLVGQEIPVTTGEALSDNFDNRFRTVQRQNVGIELDVRPVVNDHGEIKLYIRQEVSSIAGPVSASVSDLIVNKREFETVVVVSDGQIAAVGGLLDDNERRTLQRVPFLGDLPGIGALFRSKGRTRTKTNLMVFIRPTILRTPEEVNELAARRFASVRDDQARYDVDGQPGIEALVRDYMGTVPPVSADPRVGDVVVHPPEAAPVITPGH